ncbi:phosphoglycerate mutase-like protein [Xylariaceae sp. FL0804]|nr:phosphoglycerate mutase-like protein [Xylariaceae sp. FL0804]
MAPIIDVVRHAESLHNVTEDGSYIFDPNLTENGYRQCRELARTYPFKWQLRHVVSSPLRRAVRTAVVAFEYAVSDGRQAILLPELQETGVLPSDTGSPREAVEAAFRPQVDVSLLDRDWNFKGEGSKYIPDVKLIEARAREARVFIRDLARKAPADAHIVVVSHGGFLHFLTEDFAGLYRPGGGYFTSYGNLTMRSFQFADLHGTGSTDGGNGDGGEDDDGDNARLVETASSRARLPFRPWVDLTPEEREQNRACAVERVDAQMRRYERMTRRGGDVQSF